MNKINKRKLLSILSLCIAAIYVIMAFIPCITKFDDNCYYSAFECACDNSAFMVNFVCGAVITVVAFVFGTLSLIIKRKAKLFIALSVVAMFAADVFMPISIILGFPFGEGVAIQIALLVIYTVLCGTVFIWNLVLKTKAASAEQSTASTEVNAATTGATNNANSINRQSVSTGAVESTNNIGRQSAAPTGRQNNYVEDKPMTKKDAEGLLAYIWVRQYNTLPFEEASEKIMAYLIENKYVVTPEAKADYVDSVSADSATTTTKTKAAQSG